MSIFRNRHVQIAMVLAPLLGVVSYYVTRDLGSETPHAAIEGQSYELAEKPNCRRSGGNCELKNGDFELNLSVDGLAGNRVRLTLQSAFPLEGIRVALAYDETSEEQPVDMLAASADGLQWSLEMERPDPERTRMHLVASASGSLYFGDIATKFTVHGESAN